VKRLLRKGSVGRRVFITIVAGEMVFAAVMGVTIGAFSVLSDIHQQQETMRRVSASFAANLMPEIADQQLTHVAAQLESILKTAEVHDVIGICIEDASGKVIVCQGKKSPPDTDEGVRSPLSVLTQEQTVVEPVIVDGLHVASVIVRFAPRGVTPLGTPLLASMIVLATMIAMSIPWAAWRLSLDVVEPLEDLGDYAARLAVGELDAPLPGGTITEIVEFQQGLREMAEQIQSRDKQLLDTYHELESAYHELEQKKNEIEQFSAVKSNFVAIAAHEIRAPLARVSLYAELLEEGEIGKLDATAREAVEAISSAATSLTSIVSDLLDSALLERGLLPIIFGDVDLVKLIEDTLRDSRLLADAHGISVALQGEIPHLTLRGDGSRLRQVLDNLLSNAFKYSTTGSHVLVSATEDAEHVYIKVADEGRGISSEDASVLFTLFGRIDVGDSRDTAGLGLGLAISARIVEAHGGRLTHRPNETGAGSVFCVEIPASGGEERKDTMIKVSGDDSDA
jgi:signal transduction histidine kinase